MVFTFTVVRLGAFVCGVAFAISLFVLARMIFLGNSPWKIVKIYTRKVNNNALAAKFADVSQNGNSSCSSGFIDSIDDTQDSARLKGSCCSPMSMRRYSEQVEGLKKYSNIPEIPSDPYDIEVGLAKKFRCMGPF